MPGKGSHPYCLFHLATAPGTNPVVDWSVLFGEGLLQRHFSPITTLCAIIVMTIGIYYYDEGTTFERDPVDQPVGRSDRRFVTDDVVFVMHRLAEFTLHSAYVYSVTEPTPAHDGGFSDR
ncbi:unnamed protein product [Soboliphyme baturini]|uniref:Aa_trans domain-containing protein n=1 Tax=Soboliphyme baturini TaxID=241478 RepID=A0A183J3T8_9BILA|nr:unnamed protein product [Soboliphyme baturini]